MNSLDTLLEIKDLSVEYIADRSIVKAVNGLSLSLQKGETLGLVGETGAGKTTTALSILRLLPPKTSRVTGGSIIYEGQDILNLSDEGIRNIRGKEISMIFQDPMTSLNPVTTIGDQIAEMLTLHSSAKEKKEIPGKVDQILEMVGIPPERKSEYPHQFSGGMKQRVVIAIALACNPALIIADEPTTALDVTIQAQVLDLIDGLKKTLNTSMVLITHDLGVVATICDKVAIMYAGEIIETGTLEQIFSNPKHPYTIGLFHSIPSLEKKKQRLIPIEGLMPDPTDLPLGCKFHPRCPHCMNACMEGVIKATCDDGHFVKCLLVDSIKEVG